MARHARPAFLRASPYRGRAGRAQRRAHPHGQSPRSRDGPDLQCTCGRHPIWRPCIVVDFGGTATTFDVVNSAGAYVGGSIAPGIEISLEALGRRGAQLRKVEFARPRSVIAKNTVEALQSGMLFGVAAQVEGIVGRMIEALGVPEADVDVIATGYLASLVADECRCFTDHAPWLTLQGLELVYRRNS